jgi:hypothetical protein
MKKLSRSLVLATANALLAALAYVCLRTESLSFLGVVVALAVIPVLLVVTLVYIVIDLRHAETRWQAVLALVVSLVPFLFRQGLEM